MRRTRWGTALAVGVLALGATAGCGDATIPDGTPSISLPIESSGTAPAALPGTACDLLATEAVTAFMGQPVRVDDGNETECVWLAETEGIYQLHLQVYASRSFYAPDQWGTVEPIPDLGEEAFLVRQAVVGTVAGYWDGEHAVFLNYAKLIGTAATEERADELVLLLRVVANRLG